MIGRPYKYDEAQMEELKQMILGQCHGTEFPILFGVDIGHTDPMLTIPLNAQASLDSEADEFVILEPGVAKPKNESRRGGKQVEREREGEE